MPARQYPDYDWKALCELYGNKCAYCRGRSGALRQTTRDHIIPQSFGGSNAYENIVPACLICNAAKWVQILTDEDYVKRGWERPFHGAGAIKSADKTLLKIAIILRLIAAA